MSKRLDDLRTWMKRSQTDAVLVTTEYNQTWLCGFPFTDGYLLVCGENAYLLTDSRYTEAAQAERDKAFEVLEMPRDFGKFLSELLKKNGAHTLGIEDMELSYYRAEQLRGIPDAPELRPMGTFFSDAREYKDEKEIACIKEAQRITDGAFAHILGYIRPGMTETEIAVELEFAMRRAGATARSFDFIVVSGSASSRPHGVPRNQPIEKGFLTMDIGCMYGGYCSDMTRTVCIGRADSEMKKLYHTVKEAQEAALAAIHEGAFCREVDAVARNIIEKDYKGCFGHGLGHGVGMLIHEAPRLSPVVKETKRLERGHVVTVEPGIYLEGKYGCRIEDMVIMGEAGAEDITHANKELIELF